MINSQNITVFNVELGFTALPHLPDVSGAQDLGTATLKRLFTALLLPSKRPAKLPAAIYLDAPE
jgi:hypothetical protein